MKIFFVDYDLRGDRDYQTLYDELNRLHGIRVLESLWSLKLNDNTDCELVRDHLMQFIDSDDGIIVSEVRAYAWSRVDNKPHSF
jgi:hypothetical protein